MRVSTAFSRLLRLSGVWVRSVSFEPDRVVVGVALRLGVFIARSARIRRGIARTVSSTSRSGATLTWGCGGWRFARA